jgi:hypothetical protein
MTQLQRVPEIVLPDGKIIVKGDIFKVSGEYGLRFRFDGLVTNPDSGAEWVDCYEMFRGHAGAFRSFKRDRIKRIPKKRVKK